MLLTQHINSSIEDVLDATTRSTLALLPAKEVTLATISSLLANSDYVAALLKLVPPPPTDGTPYSRKPFYNGPLGEAMIAHWAEGAACLPHDHGEASGLVTVLTGEFLEQSYSLTRGLEKQGDEKPYVAGNSLAVEPGDVHSMRAVKGGITLHLYTPAIQNMKVYDENHVYTVADNCGAWLPEPHLILRRETLSRNPIHH